MEHFKKFYTCARCGGAICGEKSSFFVCPNCGKALCRQEELPSFNNKYCGNCGSELARAKEEAQAN